MNREQEARLLKFVKDRIIFNFQNNYMAAYDEDHVIFGKLKAILAERELVSS